MIAPAITRGALAHEAPKLSAVGVGYLNDDSPARLERQIRYMESKMKLIEARPGKAAPTSEDVPCPMR